MYRLSLLSLLLLAVAAPLPAKTADRPNIVVILADDIGREVIGAYGGESYPTPSIDRLAAEGVRFENAHATPLCTPSRVMLLTGKDSWRNYTDFGYLDPGETTFAQRLAEAGYVTFAAGKWQLVSNKYQNLAGMTPAAAGFADYALWEVRAREESSDRYYGPTIHTPDGAQPHDADSYGPDIFRATLIDFIRREAGGDRPFLAYYPMILPHRRFAAPPGAGEGDRQQRFAAMIAYMDTIVGDIRATLEATGVADNTLLLFAGDNGTDYKITSRWHGEDIAGGKALTIDSATHVPFVAWWPGRIAPSARDELVYLADVLPTLLALGAPQQALPENIDGRDLGPLLRGQEVPWRDSLFMHYDPRWSDNVPARYAFDTRWKLYEDGRFYDIAADPLERSALESPLPEEAEAARARLQQRLDTAGGELSGVLSPQSRRRRERDLRRTVIALGVLALAGVWYGRRRLRRSAPN